mmetsp:Transcript_7890/g.22369  ORF Transcript_7890/g.22369 Transcript_7890/m.22369 type:complete len:223 (+) Transcript_7890:1219-1887(+)
MLPDPLIRPDAFTPAPLVSPSRQGPIARSLVVRPHSLALPSLLGPQHGRPEGVGGALERSDGVDGALCSRQEDAATCAPCPLVVRHVSQEPPAVVVHPFLGVELDEGRPVDGKVVDDRPLLLWADPHVAPGAAALAALGALEPHPSLCVEPSHTPAAAVTIGGEDDTVFFCVCSRAVVLMPRCLESIARLRCRPAVGVAEGDEEREGGGGLKGREADGQGRQ